MGVLSEYFPNTQTSRPTLRASYGTFTEPSPSFVAWDGSLYDHPLTRAAIERFAVACSKLKPEYVGTAKPSVRKLVETWPNALMTWPQFLARTATIYEMDTTVFIVPALDRDEKTVALFPMKASYVEIAEWQGEPWCIFHLMNGGEMAMEYARCAVVSKFQYLSDFFGAGNEVMRTTLQLMDAQRQAEEQAVQNGARIRFIGKITGMTHGDDLNVKREKFYIDNLSSANYTGLMLYDQTFEDIEQVKEDRFIIDPDEMERVEKTVFRYFGTNDKILQNSYSEDEWGAYYEGKIEPFAIKLAEALNKSQLTERERKTNYIMFSSSRLQYASNNTKLKVIQGLGNMGYLRVNEGRAIMQLPPVPGGNARPMRGEYYLIDDDNNVIAESGGHNGTDEPIHGDDWASDPLDDIGNETN